MNHRKCNVLVSYQVLKTWFLLAIFVICELSFVQTAGAIQTSNCSPYLTKVGSENPVAVVRVESLLGHNAVVTDVSDSLTETRSATDPNLRVINLGEIFSEGRLFLGFGRPNVYLGIPSTNRRGLGYAKVDAKSFKRADTKVSPTGDKVQSGLLLVFKDLSPEVAKEIFEVAKRHEGSRQWTCVNANCRILSEAGFTLGGESLSNYYFPVRLLQDILQYGLEYKGRPVSFDVVKTTPGYLEDIGLSITHAVYSTLCRHAERSCVSIAEKVRKNSVLVQIKQGLKSKLGLAIFDLEEPEPLIKPVVESQITFVNVAPSDQRNYLLDVSEPSQFGLLLRLVFGPHSLFEVPINQTLVDAELPNRLKAYPDEQPSLLTRIKKSILFNPGIVSMIRSQLMNSYRSIDGMNQSTLFGMLRTSSPEFPNYYNFVMTGSRLIVMKVAIRNAYMVSCPRSLRTKWSRV